MSPQRKRRPTGRPRTRSTYAELDKRRIAACACWLVANARGKSKASRASSSVAAEVAERLTKFLGGLEESWIEKARAELKDDADVRAIRARKYTALEWLVILDVRRVRASVLGRARFDSDIEAFGSLVDGFDVARKAALS